MENYCRLDFPTCSNCPAGGAEDRTQQICLPACHTGCHTPTPHHAAINKRQINRTRTSCAAPWPLGAPPRTARHICHQGTTTQQWLFLGVTVVDECERQALPLLPVQLARALSAHTPSAHYCYCIITQQAAVVRADRRFYDFIPCRVQ